LVNISNQEAVEFISVFSYSHYSIHPMPKDKRKFYESDSDDKYSSSKKLKSSNMFFSNFYRRKDSDASNFSQKKCISLFNEYASKEDKSIIDPNGIQQFCNDINVHIEDPVMLVLSYKMDCKQMGFFTLKEWLTGLSELQCDSLNKIKSKIEFLRQLLNDPATFKSIYRYSFAWTKEPNQKFLEMNTAKALLKLLLFEVNKWPMFHYFIEFLSQSNYTYINLDQWCNILEFSKTIGPDLANYDEDSAWPIMLDEFCSWYKLNVLQNEQ